jgi:hypothetical protein
MWTDTCQLCELRYECEGQPYAQETFASVDPELAARGAMLVKFDLPVADRGRIELRFEAGYDLLRVDGEHVVRDAAGTPLAQLGDGWEFAPARSSFFSKVEHPASLVAMIYTAAPATQPSTRAGIGMAPEMEAAGRAWASTRPSPVDLDFYQRQRELCIRRWGEIVAAGMQVDVPEKVVNDGWRTLIVAQHTILRGGQMNYSASNQYQRQYANESGDSIRSLAMWATKTPRATRSSRCSNTSACGRCCTMRRSSSGPVRRLLSDARQASRRSASPAVAEGSRPTHPLKTGQRLAPERALLLRHPDPVNSLNNNANAWRGLRDLSIVLAECGDTAEAARLGKSPPSTNRSCWRRWRRRSFATWIRPSSRSRWTARNATESDHVHAAG